MKRDKEVTNGEKLLSMSFIKEKRSKFDNLLKEAHDFDIKTYLEEGEDQED